MTRSLREDERWNDATGLIECAECHAPRQKQVSVLGREYLMDCLCKCQVRRREMEKAAQKHREFLDQIARLKAEGLQDKSLRDNTFANDKGYNPEIEKAKQYVAHWERLQKSATGLLLWGDIGTGKTFIAGCIANALLEQGVPVLMTNFPRILNSLTDLHHTERNQFVDSLNKYSLLILDDLGIERNTEFAMEQLFHVIDSRYRSRKPMIVTTNIPLAEMKHPTDLAHARIYGRILERCVPLKINNMDIRKQNADANLEEIRGLFSDHE